VEPACRAPPVVTRKRRRAPPNAMGYAAHEGRQAMKVLSRIRSSLILLLVAAVTAGLTLAPSAIATYPGANGKIAFFFGAQGDYRDIFSINLDGTGLRNLTANGANNTLFRWSPDGSKIAFVSDGDGRDNAYDLYEIAADGGGLTKLSTSGEVGTFDWSPDSSKIVFSDGPLRTVNADGSGLTQITDSEHLYQRPAWSPDGNKIAVEKDPSPTSQIYTINPDGTGETRVTDTRYEEVGPVWSPDGKKLAVTTNRETGCQTDRCYTIYIMNADGSAQTRLTDETVTDFAPQWSPDGSKIAFLSGLYLYTINADGTHERRLAVANGYETWSPDSSQIAFARFAIADPKIYLINADGSGERFLVDGSAPDWQRLVRSAFKNAAEFCKAQREASGHTAFRQRYGTVGRCIRQNRVS
jgi:Tol biopolymer transport system component